MEVVASSMILRKFRQIKEYTLDMGISKTKEVQKEGNKGPSQIVIKIKDPFIKRYSIEKERFIVKAGYIGSLDFYMDNLMPPNNFSIYDEDREYNFEYKDTPDVRSYLSDILDKILNEQIEPVNLAQNMEEEIEFKMDKNLPQQEFIDKYNELRERMNKMGVDPNNKRN